MNLEKLRKDLRDSAKYEIAEALHEAVKDVADDMFMDAAPSKDGKSFDINLYDGAGNPIKRESLDWLIDCYFDSNTSGQGVLREAQPMVNALIAIIKKVHARIEKHGWRKI